MAERHFVSGGAGFIGSHLVDALLDRGAEVTVYDNLSLGRREFLDGALKRGARLVVADLLDTDRVAAELDGHDMVWHLAANSDIRQGTRSTSLDLEQGILVTHSVLEAMRRQGVGRIAFASSSVVYGEPSVMPTPEEYGPLTPISLYGAAKLGAEGLISAFGHCYGINANIFRFANIIGPRSTHGILHDFAAKLREDSAELEVLGDGRQQKSYLGVDDCVAAMLHVADHAPGPLSIHNLAAADNITVARIAELVVEAWTGGKAALRYTGGRRGWTGDVPTMRLDPARLNALGWQASRTSEEAVRHAIAALDPKIKCQVIGSDPIT